MLAFFPIAGDNRVIMKRKNRKHIRTERLILNINQKVKYTKSMLSFHIHVSRVMHKIPQINESINQREISKIIIVSELRLILSTLGTERGTSRCSIVGIVVVRRTTSAIESDHQS